MHIENTFKTFVTSALLTVAQVAGAATVVEFYNSKLDNYFLTSDAAEAAEIDKGSAGSGWSRTGEALQAGLRVGVCRFYGSQSPGPNSHFYTVDPGECAALKKIQASTPDTEQRWNFEGLDFAATASTNGACPNGTLSIYRAYNNGSTRGVDSNHRITSSVTAIKEVVARGWINDGVVMCTQTQTISEFMASKYSIMDFDLAIESYC